MNPAPKSFATKLQRLQHDSNCRDFILADAKDADMAFGLSSTGRNPANNSSYPHRSLGEFREAMREIVRQGLVDIMLMSASSSELLTIRERLFDGSPVTAAVRVNDSTDIWLGGAGPYGKQPSLPFRTTSIDHIQCGKVRCEPHERTLGANLGLYSLTLNNNAQLDRETLQQYRDFRHEAEGCGFQHFLEVFAPNAPNVSVPFETSCFVNDSIARLLAGVPQGSRPLFLKIPYFGGRAMEALVHYDASLIVGVLGGAAGTTHDAYWLVADAKKHGARAALLGRKINHAEDALAFVKYLRAVADEEVAPEEAVRAYHADLGRSRVCPHRELTEDLLLTQVPAES